MSVNGTWLNAGTALLDGHGRIVESNDEFAFWAGISESRQIDSDSEVSGFENSRALEARLKELPNVRQDIVHHGRRLIGDPAYPPRETIQKIAALLALKSKESDSES